MALLDIADLDAASLRDSRHGNSRPGEGAQSRAGLLTRSRDPIHMGSDPSGVVLDNLALPASQDNSLMIRKCCVEAEKLVWKRALSWPRSGVIITGQPGIGIIISHVFLYVFAKTFVGKTLFIWYLLLHPLNMNLLHATGEDVLFYGNGGVYSAGARDPRGSNLPWLWFPVQSLSPNPDLYNWRKEQGPLYIVFPLWTLKELRHV
jgi:hypothetical protein